MNQVSCLRNRRRLCIVPYFFLASKCDKLPPARRVSSRGAMFAHFLVLLALLSLRKIKDYSWSNLIFFTVILDQHVSFQLAFILLLHYNKALVTSHVLKCPAFFSITDLTISVFLASILICPEWLVFG